MAGESPRVCGGCVAYVNINVNRNIKYNTDAEYIRGLCIYAERNILFSGQAVTYTFVLYIICLKEHWLCIFTEYLYAFF